MVMMRKFNYWHLTYTDRVIFTIAYQFLASDSRTSLLTPILLPPNAFNFTQVSADSKWFSLIPLPMP